MSYLWSFSSFDPARFTRLLGPRPGLNEDDFRDMLGWDDLDAQDRVVMGKLISHLATSGFTYAGLDHRMVQGLDAVVPILFSPEGLEAELDIRAVSDRGVHPSVLKELLRRAAGAGLDAPLLTLLETGGRRTNAKDVATAEPCEYCILQPKEAVALLAEVHVAAELDAPWSSADVLEIVERGLIDALERVTLRNRALVGILG